MSRENVFSYRDLKHATYSGVVAGFIPALFSRPFLVITTPMHTEMKKGIFTVAKAIHHQYGWRGFTSGITLSLASTVPGTPLMYVGSRITNQFLGESVPAKLLSGYVGMAAGCLAYVPPTIVNQAKQTLEVNKTLQKSNHFEIAKILYQQKGIAGFYTGYWLQMASFGTCNAFGLFFASEIAKLAKKKGYEKNNATTFVSYALGYMLAGAVTNPLEIIKRQRQAAWANHSLFPDNSSFDVIKRLVKNHGFFSLYRGAHVYGLWAAVRFGSAYATGDTVKQYLANKFSK